MVELHAPSFLDWEILQEGAESQWGFTHLKSSEPEGPWPWLWQTSPVLALSLLGPLPPFPALPCSLWTRAALLMSFTRQHNPNQGCFKVSTVQAQQVVLEEHSNSSFIWPFLFLHEIVLGVCGLAAVTVSDYLFMQASQIHLWMLFLRQDPPLD